MTTSIRIRVIVLVDITGQIVKMVGYLYVSVRHTIILYNVVLLDLGILRKNKKY